MAAVIQHPSHDIPLMSFWYSDVRLTAVMISVITCDCLLAVAGGGGTDMTTLLDFRSCSGVSDSTLSRGAIDIPATFVTYVMGFQPSTWLNTVPTAKNRGIGIEARMSPMAVPSEDCTPGE